MATLLSKNGDAPVLRIHAVGAGGVGMYGLCRLALDRGHILTCSDRQSGRYLADLASRGAKVTVGQSPGDAAAADLVVASLAVPETDADLSAARAAGIPIFTRPKFAGSLFAGFPHRIGVAGSHGKSTVTAMLAGIFSAAGLCPTVLCGADLPEEGLPYRAGKGDLLIYEACEYRRAFLSMPPTVALITNTEWDHTDCYRDLSEIREAFSSFALSADRVVTFPEEAKALTCPKDRFAFPDLPSNVVSDGGRYAFDLPRIGRISLAVPGVFEVKNASLAAKAAELSGIGHETIRASLSSFPGIDRRLQCIRNNGGFTVYYDYAHHPTEIEAGIATLREMHPGERLTVVFCPHTYSRTKDLFSGFVSSLGKADRVLIAPIFPAREAPIPGITSEALAAAIGDAASALSEKEILCRLAPGVTVLMGAGDLSYLKSAIENDRKGC